MWVQVGDSESCTPFARDVLHLDRQLRMHLEQELLHKGSQL
jgi:hypothetical protein